MIPQPTEIRWRLSGTSPSLGARRLYSLDLYLSRPAVSILKEQGRGVLSASAPEISAYIDPFGPVVSLMIPLPTEIRWRLNGTCPSLGTRRLYSLDLFLSRSAVSILKEQGGRGGTQRFGTGNRCLYCPFWARGTIDNTPTHRNLEAPEWHKS